MVSQRCVPRRHTSTTSGAALTPANTSHPNAADRTYLTAYDAAGRPLRAGQPGGYTNSYAYNITQTSNSMVETATGGTATMTRTRTFDTEGRPATVSSGASTYSYGYDARDLLTSVSGSPTGVSTFAYHPSG